MNIIVRRPPDGDRTRPQRHVFQRCALKFQNESRHGSSPPADAGAKLPGVSFPYLQPPPKPYPCFPSHIYTRRNKPSAFSSTCNTITLTLSTPPLSLARSTSRSA